MNNRIKVLNDAPMNRSKAYVLYWMQHTQRTFQNAALVHAIHRANEAGKPLKVLFCIAHAFEDGADRHYHFMIEGLKELKETFEKEGIDFTVVKGDFLEEVPPYFKDATELIIDKAYLRPLRNLRRKILKEASTLRVSEVESDLAVPIEEASDKLEYAARTIRKKLWKALETADPIPDTPSLNHPSTGHAEILNEPAAAIIKDCAIDHDVGKVERFKGGEKEALRRFQAFHEKGIHGYSKKSSDPGIYQVSTLSPYLHFGMIAPLYMLETIQRKVSKGRIAQEDADAYLEQLIVRRELAFNYVYFLEDGYDRFDKMTYGWAYKTMEDHEDDARPYLYDMTTLISAKTHDPYWNAAMREMVDTGFMHNTMRMYWGKKIIEWSKTHEAAFKTIKTLNNRYFLDGRDPNSYAGIAWCFGRHDRAFKERAILGKLRPLSENGLKRKYDIDAYVKRFGSE
ncbi:MAG: deoxyribodipyrimidine photo-lyase [Bacillota bacterium]